MGIRKFVRKAKKFVKKRYNVGGKRQLANINMKQVVNDVTKAMSMLNAEKKINEIGPIASTVGQVAYNSTGALCLDVTPMMAQGADQFQRNGISIKLHTALWQIQISQQTASTCANTFHFELWLNKGTVLDQATLLGNVYDPSVFSGVIDATSSRNADHFGEYQLIRKVTRRLSDPNYSTDLTNSTFTIPIKFNKGHHVRYTGSGSTNYLTDVQNGQIFIICRADNGNRQTVNTSTLPVAIKAPSTGINFAWAVKTWFYDN